MKKFRKALIWSAMNDRMHSSLMNEEEDQPLPYMPIIDVMFPGINCYSVFGYREVQRRFLKPVLEKHYPKLKSASEGEISPNDRLEIKEVLPSKGLEWHDSPEWQERFKKILVDA